MSSLAALLTLTACLGCGDGLPRRVPISGTVLLDGEPLPLGSVSFTPEGMRPSSSKIDAEGRFDLQFMDGGKGAVLGLHRIRVAAFDNSSGRRVSLVPKRYTDFRTSGLTFEVSESNDTVVLELSSGGA